MYYEIRDLKMQMQKAEKELAFIKSNSTYQPRYFFLKLDPNQLIFYMDARKVWLNQKNNEFILT